IKEFSKTATNKNHFVELKGYSREETNALMQASDVLLMCSKSEGSPQVIKEAIINKLPIISNDVGDVSLICNNIDNCFIVPKQITAYTNLLNTISANPRRILDNSPILELYDNKKVSKNIYHVYQEVLNISYTG